MSSGVPTMGQSASSSSVSTQSGQFSALYMARSFSRPTLLRARSNRNCCTSFRLRPPEAMVCACSGPKATSTSPRITEARIPARLMPSGLTTVIVIRDVSPSIASARPALSDLPDGRWNSVAPLSLLGTEGAHEDRSPEGGHVVHGGVPGNLGDPDHLVGRSVDQVHRVSRGALRDLRAEAAVLFHELKALV